MISGNPFDITTYKVGQINAVERVSYSCMSPVSILRKSIAGRYRPVRIADGPITVRCRFIKNASHILFLTDFLTQH